MAAAFGLQIGRDNGPERAKSSTADRGGRQCNRPVRPVNRQGHQRDAKPAQHRLTFAADVEQPRLIGGGHGQTGKDEVGGVIQRISPAVGRAETAGHHRFQRPERIAANGPDDEARQGKGNQDIDQRYQRNISPFWHLLHQFAFLLIPAINRPSSFSSVSSGRRSPMI